MSTDAMKQALEQALEMLTDNREYIEANERSEYLAMYDKVIAGAEKALAEQPAQQEPVACPVCNQVHTILDADESQIIRDAKDGYPDGRTPRLLTLQERVTALCQYASDWKRWCLEKENATPQAQPAREPLTWEQRVKIVSNAQRNELDEYDLIEAIEAAHGITKGNT